MSSHLFPVQIILISIEKLMGSLFTLVRLWRRINMTARGRFAVDCDFNTRWLSNESSLQTENIGGSAGLEMAPKLQIIGEDWKKFALKKFPQLTMVVVLKSVLSKELISSSPSPPSKTTYFFPNLLETTPRNFQKIKNEKDFGSIKPTNLLTGARCKQVN